MTLKEFCFNGMQYLEDSGYDTDYYRPDLVMKRPKGFSCFDIESARFENTNFGKVFAKAISMGKGKEAFDMAMNMMDYDIEDAAILLNKFLEGELK